MDQVVFCHQGQLLCIRCGSGCAYRNGDLPWRWSVGLWGGNPQKASTVPAKGSLYMQRVVYSRRSAILAFLAPF